MFVRSSIRLLATLPFVDTAGPTLYFVSFGPIGPKDQGVIDKVQITNKTRLTKPQ